MTEEVSETEKYLGGFRSPSIRRRRLDLRPCGLYATNKRIFLVRSPNTLQISYIALWVIALILLISALVYNFLTLNLGTYPSNFLHEQALLWLGLAFLFIVI
jgi:hypothetical protein